jgi:phosphoribosyl-AMP cyclohydrolase
MTLEGRGMSEDQGYGFGAQGSVTEVERGMSLQPKFDREGLIPAIVTDSASGKVLMFAWMDREALARTIESRIGHFWSRSRKRIWVKGEESGNVLEVAEMRVDCDQDVLWLSVAVRGKGVACHTGAPSCFYRRVVLGETDMRAAKLEPTADA